MDIPSTLPSDFRMKLRILDYFEDLMRTNPVDSLSVTSICKCAGISRPTFYRHFSDKYDISNWLSNAISEVSMFQIGRSLSWHDGIYLHTSLWDAKKDFQYGFAQSSSYSATRVYAARVFVKALKTTVTDYRKEELTDKLMFQIICASEEIHSAANRRVLRGFDLTPGEFADYATSIVPRDLFELLDTPIADPPANLEQIMMLLGVLSQDNQAPRASFTNQMVDDIKHDDDHFGDLQSPLVIAEKASHFRGPL